jgi:lipoic acid synthetase
MDDMHEKLPGRKPPWLKVSGFSGHQFEQVSHLLKAYGLNTVCQAANCPNRGECFNRGTATFLIMGPLCTRNCRFCDVPPGVPGELDPGEPLRVAQAAAELKLRHVVITSVTRDDLPDGGAGQFVQVVREIRRLLPQATVEILTPDFKGVDNAAELMIGARPDVFNHNLETVPRLYPRVRPGADYGRSLELLRQVGEGSDFATKSGLMLGLGETTGELQTVFDDLSAAGVSILTMGQYLAPSREHYPVQRYVPPEEFEQIGQMARQAGILRVISAPLVRSSYRADEAMGDSH